MYKCNRYKQYSHLRNMITKNEINSCLHLINRIKEHRHDKMKTKQIVRFKCLYFKMYGYHHNLTRGSANLTTLAKFLCVDTDKTFHPAVPVLHPMPVATQQILQHPLLQHQLSPHHWHPQWHPATQVPDLVIHAPVPLMTPNKSGSSISPTPPFLQCKNPYWQEAQILP